MGVSQSANLLIDREIDGQLHASPFFWPQKASQDADSDWIWGVVTTEFDLEQDGSVAVIHLLRGDTDASHLTTLKGFDLYEGEAVTVGDWNGDGENELIAVDADGQLRVYGYEGRVAEGIVTRPVSETIVRRRPVVATFADGSRPILCFASAAAPYIGAEGAIHAYQAPGQPLPGLPMELDPPPISPVAVVSSPSGAKILAFVRENGSISVYDVSRKILHQVARVKEDLADETVIVAADVDSNGHDEIVFAHGGDCIYALSVTPESVQRAIAVQHPGGEFAAVAAGVKTDGQAVLCFYDRVGQQFGFFAGAELSWYKPEDIGPAHSLVNLSAGPTLGGAGSVFVAVFYNSAGSTEILLLDSNASAIGDAPIKIEGFCPFIDGDNTMALVPSALYDPSRSGLLLLAGLYPCAGDDPPRVRMYEIDCSQR